VQIISVGVSQSAAPNRWDIGEGE